jgi:hypothetical protein
MVSVGSYDYSLVSNLPTNQLSATTNFTYLRHVSQEETVDGTLLLKWCHNADPESAAKLFGALVLKFSFYALNRIRPLIKAYMYVCSISPPNPILGEQTPNPWPIISRLYKKRGHCYYTPSTPNHADSKANMKLFANHIAMHIESALGDTQSTGKSNFELKTMLTPINGGAYSRMKREVCIVTPPMPRK